MSNRYHYLEVLGCLPEFSFLQKYAIQKWSADDFAQLFGQLGAWEIKDNKKDSEYYDKLIQTVISEFLCENITDNKLKSILDAKLFYRRQLLVEELKKKQEAEKKMFREIIVNCVNEEHLEEMEEEYYF